MQTSAHSVKKFQLLNEDTLNEDTLNEDTLNKDPLNKDIRH